MACRDVAKGEATAKELGFKQGQYCVMQLDLNSLQSVVDFVDAFRRTGRRLDCLCCNAAVYLPNQPGPTWTVDGFEESFGVNHLSHYLLARLMIPDLQKGVDPRCIIVGSITGNTNTVGGGTVYPKANHGQYEGLEMGARKPVSMMDGKEFNGAKAYKDSKLANMMTVLELHRRYHEDTGIVFNSMYPGCIAETALFRQKRGWFRKLFPVFMRYVTGGYVSQEESGDRLAQVCSAPETVKSGVYWSWNGGAKRVGVYDFKSGQVVGAGGAGGELFENTPSGAVRDPVKGAMLWELSEKLVSPFLKDAKPLKNSKGKLLGAPVRA